MDDYTILQLKSLKTKQSFLESNWEEKNYLFQLKVIPRFHQDFSEIIPESEKQLGNERKKRPRKIVNDIFKKLSTKLHPDKGGDKELFQQANEAKENNNLSELLDIANEVNVRIEDTEDMIPILQERNHITQNKIDMIEKSLAWQWYFYDDEEKEKAKPIFLDILKKIKIKKQHNLDKSAVIKKYNLSRKQVDLIDSYILKLTKSNQIHNLVGPSTIDVAWDRHINDSLQLSGFIKKKSASIIDLGTGAGLPGVILHIFGYLNILLIDSKMKKINFIKEFAHEQKLEIKTICTRVEKIKNQKFDFIICRAFAPLAKLLDYSRFFSKKNTIF